MAHLARNQAIDHLRRGATRNSYETGRYCNFDDGESCELAQTSMDLTPRPEQWLESKQDRARLEHSMTGLSSAQRQVMELAFRDGCSQADIALRMQAPLGSIKSWMRRGLQQMKAALEQSEAATSRSNA